MPSSSSSSASPAVPPLAPARSEAHGQLVLPHVTVDSYSLDLRDDAGDFVGDRASRRAFGQMLDAWRAVYRTMAGQDPVGDLPTVELGRKRLETLLCADGDAAAVIEAACEDYALQFADVVQHFLAQPSWRGVERIVVGGGFQQSTIGRRAIHRTATLLARKHVAVELSTLRHHADEGGLIGWVQLAPPDMLAKRPALLAVDIGGTNARCGIVRAHGAREANLSNVEVVGRDKWMHAGDADAKQREDLVQGIADMLKRLIAQAEKQGIPLSPFIGVACPGIVRPDGTIADGTQNLPGNWETARFNLPQELAGRLPRIGGKGARVVLHNDAVVQGLSERSFMAGVRRWAVLTVGTGLGNATYTNR